MTAAEHITAQEGFACEAKRRKRLGQFFTGTSLGRVLAALSQAEKAQSIVDPMAGSGDLIAACLELGASPEAIGAIEIDPAAYRICNKRLPNATCINGNAFDPTVLGCLPRQEWDLVITNPPYVRYQNMSKGAGNAYRLPGAIDVRNGLIESLEHMPALDAEDKALFLSLASGYSGLADLAVPSWILCASMVRIGGRLALVVPESWLSRDYSAVVHYLLLRWFVIENIVEDEHAAWFDDAQIKTTLLIARRVKRRASAFKWKDELFVRSRISGKAIGPESPIGNLYPLEKNPEIMFAKNTMEVISTGTPAFLKLGEIVPTPISSMAHSLESTVFRMKWFSKMGEKLSEYSTACAIPPVIRAWIGDDVEIRLVPLETLNVSVGQGLRTGANKFFYAELVSTCNKTATLLSELTPGAQLVRVPLSCIHPVIRRQSELPEGFCVYARKLTGRVLDLRRTALIEDIAAGGTAEKTTYTPIDEPLAQYVRTAASVNIGTNSEFRIISQLSAVAPNIRSGNPNKGIAQRYWYMLPDFAPRHTPDIIVPRVNGGSPRALILADKGIVADANFSTINVEGPAPDAFAILAILNSSWCQAILENTSSIMGGGALKVEATHLRKLPIPALTPVKWRQLSELGRRLAESGDDITEINRVVASGVLGRLATNEETSALEALAIEGCVRRKNHK